MILLTSGAKGRLPLVLRVRCKHVLAIAARQPLSVSHLHCCLPPLRGSLTLLAVTCLFLSLLGELSFGVLVRVILVLHPLLVAQAGLRGWGVALGLLADHFHLIVLLGSEHRPDHLLAHLQVGSDADRALRNRVVSQLAVAK